MSVSKGYRESSKPEMEKEPRNWGLFRFILLESLVAAIMAMNIYLVFTKGFEYGLIVSAMAWPVTGYEVWRSSTRDRGRRMKRELCGFRFRCDPHEVDRCLTCVQCH